MNAATVLASLAALAPFARFALTGFPCGLIVTIQYAAELGISLVRPGRQVAATAAAATAPAASAA